ncbi:MAG: FHA domain-containing protein [Planctomycetota bacterium]
MPQLYLKFLSDPQKNSVFTLPENKSFIIGRVDSCDLKIDEGSVSRNHAEISLKASQWILQDSSKSGTRVNGQKVTEYQLQEGDVITIGKKDMKFTSDPNKPDNKPSTPPSAPPGKKSAAPKKKHEERFKPAKSAEENSGGTAFVDMASMFGSEGGAAGTMSVDMEDFIGEDPDAGKKALQKIALISGGLVFLLALIITILYIRRATTKEILEAPLSVGEKRTITVVPYGKLDFATFESKISVEETTLNDEPTLNIVALEEGEVRIKLMDYQGNFIIYTIPIEKEQTDVIKLEVQAKYDHKSESEKMKLAKDWMGQAEPRLKQEAIDPSAKYDAFELYYKTELILMKLPNPPPIYKEAREKRKALMDDLDNIYRIRKREFEAALNVRDKKKALEIINYLKQVFHREEYFHLETKKNYRKELIWMESQAEKRK